MKLLRVQLAQLFLVCLSPGIADAFLTVRPQLSCHAKPFAFRLSASSLDNEKDPMASSGTDTDPGVAPDSWTELLDKELLAEVREELIQRYLNQGVSQEVAEEEVNIFLQDKERSEQYIEMRMYAAAQADDLGVGTILQLLGGFLVGFVGIAGPKVIAGRLCCILLSSRCSLHPFNHCSTTKPTKLCILTEMVLFHFCKNDSFSESN